MSLFGLRDWALMQARLLRKASLAVFGTRVKVRQKKDGSPVTAVDRQSERLFRRALGRDYPDHGVWGEEFGRAGGKSPWLWIIDPIDGTRAFSRGLPTWGSLITLTHRKEPVVAVADYPAIGVTLWAVRGQGAWESGSNGKAAKRLSLSNTDSWAKAVILHAGANGFIGTSWEKPLGRLLKSCYLERSFGDCYAYLHLLRGSADLLLDFNVKIWDLAPFLLMVEEAGGRLLDFKGQRRWGGPAAVCANPKLLRKFFKRIVTAHVPLSLRGAAATKQSHKGFFLDEIATPCPRQGSQ